MDQPAQSPPTQQDTSALEPTQRFSNRSKAIALVAALILMVIIIFSAMWFYANSNTNRSASKLREPDVVKSTTEVSNPTDEWISYKNEEYGFEFKYPSHLTLEEQSNSVILKQKMSECTDEDDEVCDQDYIVIETHVDEGMTLREYGIHHLLVPENHIFTPTEFGGRQALKTEVNTESRNTRDYFTSLTYNTFIHAWHSDAGASGGGNLAPEIFDRIMSSFEFFTPPFISFKNQPIDTANWKTHENNTLQISFKYDPNWFIQFSENPVLQEGPFPIQNNPIYSIDLGSYQTINHIGDEVKPYFSTIMSISKFENTTVDSINTDSLLNVYEGLAPEVQKTQENGLEIYSVYHNGSASGSSLDVFLVKDQTIYSIDIGNNASIYKDQLNGILSTLETKEFALSD